MRFLSLHVYDSTLLSCKHNGTRPRNNVNKRKNVKCPAKMDIF